MLVGLHLKSATVLAVSVTQEPLKVAIGTFRVAQLAMMTKSASGHVSALVKAMAAAFEDGTGVSLVDPQTVDLSTAIGPQHTDDGVKPLPIAASAVRVQFTCFAQQYEVTLRIRDCPDNAKDPFVFSLIMDLYRAMLRSEAARRATARHGAPVSATRNRSPSSGGDGESPPQSPPASAARRMPIHPPHSAMTPRSVVSGKTVTSRPPSAPWKATNTSRAPVATNASPFAATAPLTQMKRETWAAALGSNQTRESLRAALMTAKAELRVALKPPPTPPVMCDAAVNTGDPPTEKEHPVPPRRNPKRRLAKQPRAGAYMRAAPETPRVIGGVHVAATKIPKVDFSPESLLGPPDDIEGF